MQDLHAFTRVAELLANATISADNTPAAVALGGFNGAEIILHIGAGGITFTGANKIEFVLTHSDDNSVDTNVADKDMIGGTGITNGIIKALTSAHATSTPYRFGYIGDKRFLKLLADFSGTHGAGTPLAAVAVLGYPAHAPVANQA